MKKYNNSFLTNKGAAFHKANIWYAAGIPFTLKKIILFISNYATRLIVLFKFRKTSSNYYKYNLVRRYGPNKQICYAAEKNLYFGKDGSITVCCSSRNYKCGNIKERSIHDIWDGTEINLLRHALQKNNLNLACKTCKQRIEDGNYNAAESLSYDLFPLNRQFPTSIEFELSNECNLECIMCDADSSAAISRKVHGQNIHPQVYEHEFLEQIYSFIPHLFNTVFYGGEPFLIPVYYKIWEKIIEKNSECIVIVQTNATILNEKIKNIIEKANFQISVSIESFKKETYEKIRKNADFDTVMKNIAYFSDHARRHDYVFNISVCPMRQNWQDIPEMIHKANEMKASIFFHTVWNPSECSLYHSKFHELAEIIETFSELDLPKNTSIEAKNKHNFQGLINQLTVWKLEKESCKQ